MTAVVLLRGRGVVEARGRWVVGPEAYGVVARLGRERELTLLGTVHIHAVGVPTRLSRVDRRHGVRVPGILAVVIGDGGAERDPARWSWNVFDDGDFLALDEGEREHRITVIDAPVECWRADADGASRWERVDG